MKIMRAVHRIAVASLVFSAAGLSSGSARAGGVQVAAEGGPIFVVASKIGSGSGFDFAARVGYKLSIPLLKITPELKLTYDRVPEAGDQVSVYRGMAGGRVAILEGFTPLAFAHIGYANGSNMNGDISGVTYDVGVGLDFTLIPFIDLGVFGSYNRVQASQGAVNWLGVGAQVALVF
jgi:hypothetical protein